MKSLNVSLRREVYRDDADKIIKWLEDDEITKYLNEDQNVCSSMRQVMSRVNMPVLTHLFNQSGSFFIVTSADKNPVGFLRLVQKDNQQAELVIVIGDKKKWGQGLGTGAIFQGLKHGFFEWRINRVIAKIKHDNKRSMHVFEKVGFKREKNLSKETQLSMTLNDFLKLAV